MIHAIGDWRFSPDFLSVERDALLDFTFEARIYGTGDIMKQIHYALGAGLLALGCSQGVFGEEIAASRGERLDVSVARNLTRMQGTQISQDEQVRQDDTGNYYALRGLNSVSVKTGKFGSIKVELATLEGFQLYYGLSTTTVPAAGEATATYYNRGDLGIGREMHCIDRYDQNANQGAIACYVKNFAAGDKDTEFTFGESADIAFRNANNHEPFATVAMVFQPRSLPKMLFLVYNAAGTELLPAAALDRVGIVYGNAFAQGKRGSQLAALGTPGVNFNNHIPSNCITCHGGQPYSNASFESGNQFLPFDLDNFDFDSTHTRASQESSFRALNQIVRRVAVLNTKIDFSPADVNHSIQYQIDGWYNNPSHADVLPSCGANQACFNSGYLPSGWNTSAHGPDLYRTVIRGNCRSCHIANNAHPDLTFDDEGQFAFWFARLHGLPPSPTTINQGAAALASLVTHYDMPHALQSTRQFWMSQAPASLREYYGFLGATDAVNTLDGATGGNLVTLDPPAISAAVQSILQ